MSRCQSVLVKEEYLEQTCENVKLKDWDVVVAGEVDGGLEGHGLQAWADGMHLVKALAKHFPWHYCPAERTHTHTHANTWHFTDKPISMTLPFLAKVLLFESNISVVFLGLTSAWRGQPSESTRLSWHFNRENKLENGSATMKVRERSRDKTHLSHTLNRLPLCTWILRCSTLLMWRLGTGTHIAHNQAVKVWDYGYDTYTDPDLSWWRNKRSKQHRPMPTERMWPSILNNTAGRTAKMTQHFLGKIRQRQRKPSSSGHAHTHTQLHTIAAIDSHRLVTYISLNTETKNRKCKEKKGK